MSSSIVSPKAGGGDDRVLIRLLPDRSVVALLADGATGGGYGALAADSFIEVVGSCIEGSAGAGARIVEAFHRADRQIAALAQDCDTTGIALLVHGERFVCVSVGDSMAFMEAPGGIIELTMGQHRKPRVGSGIRNPDVREGAVTGPLLLASDGLNISPATAFALLKDARAGCRTAELASIVTDYALQRGLFDDLAVAVVDLDALAVCDTIRRSGG